MANKYHAKKVQDPHTGYWFDSKAELTRWYELKLLERAGKVTGLKRQVSFQLIPTHRAESTEVYKAGPQKGLPKPGAVIEKEVKYVADFTYYLDGEYIVEDVKGLKRGAAYELYKIKRKLMLDRHGIRINEV